MKRQFRPLDDAALRELALGYAARYATTGSKLERYLKRKVRERGWATGESPDFAHHVSRLVDLGFVNDAAYAASKSSALRRKGLGSSRIRAALSEAGIDHATAAEAIPDDVADELLAALVLARRKRMGPFSSTSVDTAIRRRWFAAFARAGHSRRVASRILALEPEEFDTLAKLLLNS